MSREDAAARWLVLAYQFPKGPDARRVKVWRRLQSIGAVAIKNSVYVLPLSDQSREDFAWLLGELRSNGADGAVLESSFVDGMTDHQVRDLFNGARNADYKVLHEEIVAAVSALIAERDGDAPEAADEARRVLARARKRIAEIEGIDFFGAGGHDNVVSAMQTLTSRLSAGTVAARREESVMTAANFEQLLGRVWVTRSGVKVDRIASAWLIRRWIDANAKFKFVAATGYTPARRELRFDMFEAEFTHQGDLCTFEVLAQLVSKNDKALRRVGEIVHDIDLKDGKFGHPETAGITSLLAGLVAATDDDLERLDRGGAMLEDLYRAFSERAA